MAKSFLCLSSTAGLEYTQHEYSVITAVLATQKRVDVEGLRVRKVGEVRSLVRVGSVTPAESPGLSIRAANML